MLRELENILQYWEEKGIDLLHGGFHGETDRTGNPVAGAQKGVVLNTRILWTFSAAYNFLKKEEYLSIATRAYAFLTNHFWDKEFQGLYWSISHDGKIIDDRKQIYAQGFGIYGFTEYYKASGNKESLDYAIKTYELIEEYSLDRENGGYIEALTRYWQPLADMRLSAKDANESKSMNTHLHIIEPYTTLLEVWPDAELAVQMKNLVRIFLDKIIDPQTNHLHLFMESDWKVKSNIVSYGHDIEAAWLLCEAAGVLGNKTLLKEAQAASIRISDATIKDGMAPDGSLYYEKDLSSNMVVEDRHWWVQVEAMVGFMNAWQISANPLYLEKVEALWDYTTKNIIDHQEGGWFNRIDKDGNPILEDPKIGFWKCPYHNTRALMEIMRRLLNIKE